MIAALKNALVAASLLLLSPLTGCIIVDGEDRSDWIVEERLLESPVTSVSVSGSADVVIIHCDCKDSIEIFAPVGEHDRASYIVSGGMLLVSGSDDMELRVYTSSLSQITLSGSSDIKVRRFDNPSLTITSSGSSDLELDGSTDQLTIRLSGSSDIDASRLRARDVSIIASGSSDISVCASDSLDVISSGSADITYHCAPDHVDATTSGSGSVRGR